MIICRVAFLRSTPGPAPCPNCDAELGTERSTQEIAALTSCPVCQQSLCGVQAAPGWRRLAAFSLDALLITLTAGPLAWGLAAAVGLEPLTDGRGIDALLQLLAGDLWRPVARAMPFLVMATTYFALFSVLRGQTPGQRWLDIRVVDRSGEQPSMARSTLRVLAGWLSLIPAGLGAVWVLFDMERRALHDHLTNTWVVRQPHAAGAQAHSGATAKVIAA